MDDLVGLSVDDFLERVAARTPTPGGGAVAAAAGACACALARMVVGYSAGDKTPPEARARIDALSLQLRRADELLRALVTQDGRAYAEMTAAAKKARTDAAAQEPAERAVLTAAGVPLQTMAVLSNVLSLLDEFKTAANRYLLSDLGVAATLAGASAQAAAYLVRVNLPQIADAAARERLARECADLAQHTSATAERLRAFVDEHMPA